MRQFCQLLVQLRDNLVAKIPNLNFAVQGFFVEPERVREVGVGYLQSNDLLLEFRSVLNCACNSQSDDNENEQKIRIEPSC